jgi:hypothetical protein
VFTLELTVRDPAGDLDVDVAVPIEERSTIDELMRQLVALLKWPRLDATGNAVDYVVLDARTMQPLPGASTVTDASLMRGSIIILAPVGANKA